MKERYYLMGYEEPIDVFFTNKGIVSRICISNDFRIVYFETYGEAKQKADEIYKETGVYMGVIKSYK